MVRNGTTMTKWDGQETTLMGLIGDGSKPQRSLGRLAQTIVKWFMGMVLGPESTLRFPHIPYYSILSHIFPRSHHYPLLRVSLLNQDNQDKATLRNLHVIHLIGQNLRGENAFRMGKLMNLFRITVFLNVSGARHTTYTRVTSVLSECQSALLT